MIGRAAVAALILAAAPVTAAAQQADLRILSAALGYSQATIADMPTTPDRALRGFNVRADLHLLSLLLHDLPVATYDALFVDYTLGSMSSAPLTFFGETEGKRGAPWNFGYHFLAGIRRPSYALLGGLGYQSWTHDIGQSMMDGTSKPFMARFELGSRRPIVVMGWMEPGGSKMVGGRIDVPFFRRLNATGMYWMANGSGEPWDQPPGTVVPAKVSLLMLGVRTAEIR